MRGWDGACCYYYYYPRAVMLVFLSGSPFLIFFIFFIFLWRIRGPLG